MSVSMHQLLLADPVDRRRTGLYGEGAHELLQALCRQILMAGNVPADAVDNRPTVIAQSNSGVAPGEHCRAHNCSLTAGFFTDQ